MSIKDKYKRTNSEPPKKKGNADIVSKIVNNDQTVNTGIQTVNTERNVKKATFELDTSLHKRLRVIAMMNDTTMLDVVKKAIIEYLNKMEN